MSSPPPSAVRFPSSIGTWWTILRICIEERLIYRGDFALGTLMRFLPIVTQTFLWTAVFVGAGRTSATAWHMVREIGRADRDVFFVRADGSPIAHFRFNTFGDAVVCAFLARQLKSERRARL